MKSLGSLAETGYGVSNDSSDRSVSEILWFSSLKTECTKRMAASMKLYQAPYSPYARMVRMVAIETGFDAELELIDIDTWNVSSELLAINPLGKVPTLVTGDGSVIYDSRVICAHFSDLSPDSPLASTSRQGMVLQALGTGLTDLLVERFVENCRPEPKRMVEWENRRSANIRRCLDTCERESDRFQGAIDLGTTALACALGYMDFRFPEDAWRDGRPRLTKWFEEFAARDSFVVTAPSD